MIQNTVAVMLILQCAFVGVH